MSEAAVRGGSRSAQVSGKIAGRLPCDNLYSDLDANKTRLSLTITLETGVNQCPGVPPTSFTYIANLLNVDPGSYTVRIVHAFEGIDRASEVVLDGEEIEVSP